MNLNKLYVETDFFMILLYSNDIAFFVLIGIFASYLMYEYCPYTIRHREILILIWIVSMTLNEFRQIYHMHRDTVTISIKKQASTLASKLEKLVTVIKMYFTGGIWDWLDVGFQLAFIIGFVLKNGVGMVLLGTSKNPNLKKFPAAAYDEYIR